jgi:hypothetical protein
MITSAIAMLRDTLYASPDISPKILLKVVLPETPVAPGGIIIRPS